MLLDTSVLPMPASARQLSAVRKQIIDRDRKIMIRIHQPHAARHDAVAVVIGVAGKGHVESSFKPDQRSHRIRRRTVHADLAIPIDAHEAERRVDFRIDDFEIAVRIFPRYAASTRCPLRQADRRPILDLAAAIAFMSITASNSFT